MTKALANPAEFLGKTIRLDGAIDEICQKKGCWMLLGGKERPLFVKFKDYAFFMPLDGAGRTAIIEGTMAMKQETVEQTKHYLEDAGKHDEAAKVTEGRKIYTFMANGVALKKRAKLDEKAYDHFGDGILEGCREPRTSSPGSSRIARLRQPDPALSSRRSVTTRVLSLWFFRPGVSRGSGSLRS